MQDEPKFGVHERSDVGFLFWHRDEEDKKRTQVTCYFHQSNYYSTVIGY